MRWILRATLAVTLAGFIASCGGGGGGGTRLVAGPSTSQAPPKGEAPPPAQTPATPSIQEPSTPPPQQPVQPPQQEPPQPTPTTPPAQSPTTPPTQTPTQPPQQEPPTEEPPQQNPPQEDPPPQQPAQPPQQEPPQEDPPQQEPPPQDPTLPQAEDDPPRIVIEDAPTARSRVIPPLLVAEELEWRLLHNDQFPNQWGMQAVKTGAAHSTIQNGDLAVKPGSDVTVGVYDTGVDAGHPIFRLTGTQITEFNWNRNIDDDTGIYRSDHGTRVASVVTTTAPGVALESYGLPRYSYYYVPRPYDKMTSADLLYINPYIESRMNFVLQREIDILNLSIGYSGLTDEYTEDVLRYAWRGAIASLAQADKDPEGRTLLVHSAGNGNGDSCLEGGTDNCVLHTDKEVEDHVTRDAICSRSYSNKYREYCVLDIEESPHNLAEFGEVCERGRYYLCILDPVSNAYRMATLGQSCEPGSSDRCILNPDFDNKVFRYALPGDVCVEETADSSSYCVVDEAGVYRIVRGGSVDADTVGIFSGLMVHIEELRGHSVAVVAVREDPSNPGSPVIADFSNRCGDAAEWCIAAPGEDITVARIAEDGVQREWRWSRYSSGTSFSAPMVSGGLALLMHRFRGQMPSVDVLQRLFRTANKTGIYEPPEGSDTSPVYGQGLMDLDAATQTVGTSSIASGATVGGPGASLHSTSLSLGPAFGAGAMHALANREVAAFDSLGAPFWHDLKSLASVPSRSLSSQLRRMLDGPAGGDTSAASPSAPLKGATRLGLAAKDPGYLGLGGPALAVSLGASDSPLAASAFTTEGRESQPSTSGLSLAWKPLGLRAGLVAERDSALGIQAEGGFGRLSAVSAFAGIDRSRTAGSWRLNASAEFGVTDPSAGRGMLSDMDSALATRLMLNASRNTGDSSWIRFSLEQPLRVERAPATLWAPVGRTKAGDVLREQWHTDLAPSGRQIDLSAWWNGPAAAGGQLRLGAVASRHPGHNAKAASSMSLLAGYRISF